jgi:predicted transcriptional regulator
VVADTLADIRARLAKEGRSVCFAASVTGTRRDPQGLDRQIKTLEDLGVAVLETDVQAARVAGYVATGGREAS